MNGFVRSAFLAVGVALAPMLVGAPPALATDEVLITVNANMARVLRINAPAATVIIGNPGIADVTIQDPRTLVLTGKSFGRTNMIVLDSAGEPIADTIVEVSQSKTDNVTVFMGMARTSMACAPDCQPVIMLGDDTDFTEKVIISSTMVQETAR